MPFKVPTKWNVFAHGKPGQRFKDRYHSHQRNRKEHGLWKRIVRMCLALAATVVGVVLVFIPGPAILFFFIAGALLASDWLWMARLLDWSEVKLRALVKWATKLWKNMPTAARAAVILAGGCLSVITMYGTYRMMK